MKNLILISLTLIVFPACSNEEERPVKHYEVPADTTSAEGMGFSADTAWKDTIHIDF